MLEPDLTTYQVYPRGFLGAHIGTRIKRMPKVFDENMRAILTNQVQLSRPQTSQIDPNPVVEKLWQDHCSIHHSAITLEFRRNVLICATHAFGNDSFLQWYLAQRKSPAMGELHRQFLDSTLTFILTGVRNLPLATWKQIVEHTDQGEVNVPVSDVAVEFFGLNGKNTGGENNINSVVEYEAGLGRRNLLDVLQLWCSQNGGLMDLFNTLHLLFGRPQSV